MVLESLLSGVLNKYLSKYIRNLDSHNLELGIFDSSLELTDLEIKPEALAQLNLPIEVVAGHIGRIYIDFSWTGLFSEPVVVNVEDLLVLVSPVADRPYDEEKARNAENASKQQKLSAIEVSKKATSDTSSKSHDLSFTEKLTAAIINNIQVNVSNVHIRYEDNSTYPGKPFAFGVALHRVSAQTTDEEWEPTQLDATATIMRKLLEAIGFSAYWNTSVEHPVSGYVRSGQWKEILKSSILSHQVKGQPFNFVVEPVTTTARLTFDKSDPPTDYTNPQIILDILTSALTISLTRPQYICIIDLAQSMQLLAVNERYRKYRPGVHVQGNTKKWWHYAYKAILEEHIRPWSAPRIEAHLEVYNTYWQKYKQKLVLQEAKQSTEALDRKIKGLEDRLDLTNIIAGRERAKTEFIKEKPERDRARRKKKAEDTNWFMRLIGYGDEEEEEEEDDDEDLWSQLTDEEKAKVYAGIGYSESREGSSVDASPIPVQYVRTKVSFLLDRCTVALKNRNGTILRGLLQNVQAGVQLRPVNNAVHVMLSTDAMRVEGALPNRELVPLISSEKLHPDTSMTSQVFSVDFETSPLTVPADMALAITSEPVDIVYNQYAVSELIGFLRSIAWICRVSSRLPMLGSRSCQRPPRTTFSMQYNIIKQSRWTLM
eukprot:XP_011681054.1 PREDICTED: vacuolar protein sorting-associated protein 13A-like [Strongylocentrotus purpuratus]